MDGKTSNIAFQLVLHGNIAKQVARFFFVFFHLFYRIPHLNVHSSTEIRR